MGGVVVSTTKPLQPLPHHANHLIPLGNDAAHKVQEDESRQVKKLYGFLETVFSGAFLARKLTETGGSAAKSAFGEKSLPAKRVVLSGLPGAGKKTLMRRLQLLSRTKTEFARVGGGEQMEPSPCPYEMEPTGSGAADQQVQPPTPQNVEEMSAISRNRFKAVMTLEELRLSEWLHVDMWELVGENPAVELLGHYSRQATVCIPVFIMLLDVDDDHQIPHALSILAQLRRAQGFTPKILLVLNKLDKKTDVGGGFASEVEVLSNFKETYLCGENTLHGHEEGGGMRGVSLSSVSALRGGDGVEGLFTTVGELLGVPFDGSNINSTSSTTTGSPTVVHSNEPTARAPHDNVV